MVGKIIDVIKSPEILLNIIGGVIAGFIVLILSYIYHLLKQYFVAKNFKDIFGYSDDYNIVYGLYNTPDITQEPFCSKTKLVFPKSPRKGTAISNIVAQNLEKITSIATLESIGYLLYTFGRNIKVHPNITSDEEVDDKMNLSFVSIGGLNNKTIDLLNDSGNYYLNYKCHRITQKGAEDNEYTLQQYPGFDLGIIIKIHPANNPLCTWICCAGFGLPGTSGAAYYLSHKWYDIHKWAKNKPFGCIIKTRKGNNESAELINGFVEDNWISWIFRHVFKKKEYQKIKWLKINEGQKDAEAF
jgi:hypothetical protein